MLIDNIEKVLRDLPESRDDDKVLIPYILNSYGLGLTPKQIAKFRDMPSTESIRRTRQKLQEQGKYPATDKSKNVRYNKSVNVAYKITKLKPEKVEALLQESPSLFSLDQTTVAKPDPFTSS